MLDKTHQYVTFRLDDEIYALDVANAREIVEVPKLARMPNAPPWVRGVMNLRGSVVPVIDLKEKFAMGHCELTANSCVLLVEFLMDEQLFLMGLLVDSVLEVFEYPASQIEEPPKFGSRYSPRNMRGMGRRESQVFIILEADKVFSDAELDLAGDAANEQGITMDNNAAAQGQGGKNAMV